MPVRTETIERLGSLPNVAISQGTLLSRYTRFGIGGPAEVYVETSDEQSFIEAFALARASGADHVVIGDGTNLIVSDAGFPGIVLRFTARHVHSNGTIVHAHAGAELQTLVDHCIDLGLKGIETMTGIPGSVGAAVYGNAGAYGHSIEERIKHIRFFDGSAIRTFSRAECEFHYRESVFKRHKDWIIFIAELEMDQAPAEELRKIAGEIFQIRLAKYP